MRGTRKHTPAVVVRSHSQHAGSDVLPEHTPSAASIPPVSHIGATTLVGIPAAARPLGPLSLKFVGCARCSAPLTPAVIADGTMQIICWSRQTK